MTTDERNPIDIFRDEIQRYERHLWGLHLYHWTSLWRWLQKGSFKRICGRIQTALSQAKTLLQEVESGTKQERDLALFNWPPILPGMERRTETLIILYTVVFPGRPKERLSTEEIKRLKAALARHL